MNFSRAGTCAVICAVAAAACSRQGNPQSGGTPTAAAVSSGRDAREQPASAITNVAPPGDTDVRAFVLSVTKDGTTEIALGRIAVRRAGDPEVKRFGKDMATDHTRVGDELQQIAEQLRLSLPVSSPSEQQALVDRLSKLRGKAFDRAYIDAMVIAHRRMADLLQLQDQERLRMSGSRGTGSGSHPPMATDGTAAAGQVLVFEWAAKTLPIVLAHLDRARQLQTRLNPGPVSATKPSRK